MKHTFPPIEREVEALDDFLKDWMPDPESAASQTVAGRVLLRRTTESRPVAQPGEF